MTLLFWAVVAVTAWTYVGFPLVLELRARLASRPPRSADVEPTVSVIVAAHDEAAVIGAKLANLAALDYPADRLEILVAADGCQDRTAAIAAEVATHDPRVTCLDLPRVGKAAALDAAIARAHGEIVVFTDANSMLDHDALRALVRPFADPEVGAVAGDQRYLDGDGEVADAERRYWDLDRRLKVAASRAGSVTSATGALHALRRELVDPVVEGVTDDFFLSTGAIVRGRRLVFAADAVTREPVAASAGAEFGRKVRVVTRGLRAVLVRRELLSVRRHGFYALQLFTHKVLRRSVVLGLPLLAVASAVGGRSDLVLRWAGYGQLAFYTVAAGAGLALWAGRRPPQLLRLPAYFCLVNLACAVAIWRTLRGQRTVVWQPQRAGEVADDSAVST